MNILITGTKGFIGRHLSKKLIIDHNVFFIENGKDYTRSINKFNINLLNEEHIKLLLEEELDIDLIIHTASRLASSNLEDMSLLKDNILMYENLTKIINKFSPKQVINLSSIAVYPNLDGNYTEQSEIKPSVNSEGLYGLSKFVGENILDLLCKEPNTLHLRLAQVHGDGTRSNSIFEVMKKELSESNTISVYGNGRRISAFIHIDSLIDKIIFFSNRKDLNGIFNLSDENLSYLELAQRIIKKHGNKKSKIELVNKGVSAEVCINIDKMKKVII